MKKIISLLLALMLICTFCIPAFAAEDELVEYVPSANILISDGRNYIISSGNYQVERLFVTDGTLTIGKDAGVTVNDSILCTERVNVIGFLNLYNCNKADCSKLYVAGCCAELIRPGNYAGYIDVQHIYENGVCMGCGYVCSHHGRTHGRCRDCGVEIESTSNGSILSEGYPEILYGIGGIAIGVVTTLLISRKKKVAVSSTTADDEE